MSPKMDPIFKLPPSFISPTFSRFQGPLSWSSVSKPLLYSRHSAMWFLKLNLVVPKWQEDREVKNKRVVPQNFLDHSSSDEREGFLYLSVSGTCMVTSATEMQRQELELPGSRAGKETKRWGEGRDFSLPLPHRDVPSHSLDSK